MFEFGHSSWVHKTWTTSVDYESSPLVVNSEVRDQRRRTAKISESQYGLKSKFKKKCFWVRLNVEFEWTKFKLTGSIMNGRTRFELKKRCAGVVLNKSSQGQLLKLFSSHNYLWLCYYQYTSTESTFLTTEIFIVYLSSRHRYETRKNHDLTRVQRKHFGLQHVHITKLKLTNWTWYIFKELSATVT